MRFLFWVASYPHADDPKNIDYVLWKHGLNANMNLDDALKAMTHDSWPIQRVAGLSRRQLLDRFGYVRGPQCSDYKHRTGAVEAVSLRSSNWVVILENGIAVDLWICKG